MQAAGKSIKPPSSVKLNLGEVEFWNAVIAGRPKAEWNDADLITAAQLAKTLAAIEAIGTSDVNAFDKLTRLSLAMRRSLGLDVRGKDGRASDVANRRAQSFAIEADNPLGDDLLARPSIN